jgi:hypothetical protein
MPVLMLANEGTAIRRQVYLQCVDGVDGITPETNEAFNQPQISIDGGAWTNTGIGSLVSIGNGRYYATLAQSVLQAGRRIETRYKSAATAEAVGDSIQVVAFDPANPQNLGLGSLPLPSAGALNGLPLGDASGRVTVGSNADKTGYSLVVTPPTAQQVREEMDARSTHLLSMDSRIPGTPSTFGQIGTPSTVAGIASEMAHIGSVVDATYLKTPSVSDIPTTAAIKTALQDDRVTGTTTGTITTTSVPITGAALSSTDDAYNGGFLLATSGTLKGVARKITDYVGSTTTCTTQAFPAALASGVSVAIIGNVPS